jgi:hypothetical protein
VLIQALVAASVASGEPIAPAAGKRPEAAVTKNGVSGRSAPTTSVPGPTQSVRMAIASFLERQERFRKYDDDGAPKLAKAIIAGPAEYTPAFSGKPPISIYCVEVDLIMTNRHLWATHAVLDAVITFPPSENGKQRIEASVRSVDRLKSASAKCIQAPYAPFPEIEQLRDRRRHALGKVDP